MLSGFKFSVVLLSVLTPVTSAVDFSCPKNRISPSDGSSGTLPPGATDVVNVPVMTNCSVMFDIPKGYALRMETTATYDTSAGDFVWFDSFYITSPAVKEVEFTVKTEIEVKIVSVKGFPYLGKYSYVDLTTFTQVIQPTGSYFNATLEPNKYYTILASTTTERVVFNTASRNTGFYDTTMHGVFVFDGNDIVNSDFMGRVTDLTKTYHPSKSSQMTFLNLYQKPSDTLILGNDWSKIQGMDQYGTNLIDPTTATTGYMYHVNGRPDAYYTFICDGCTSFYIESIEFDAQNDADGYVEVQGMTPTHSLQQLLRYDFSLFTNMSLPQLIPAPMATFHAFKTGIKYVIRTDVQNEWLSTALDRKRSVFSPKLWNPDADQQFDYTFSDPLKIYNFSISLDSVGLVNDGDELDVQVGSVNGLTTLDKKYTKTSMAHVSISGIGRYLHLKYVGSKTSEVKLNFKMLDATHATTDAPSGSTGTSETGTMQTSTSKPAVTGTTPTAPATNGKVSTSSSPARTSTKTLSTSNPTPSNHPSTKEPTSTLARTSPTSFPPSTPSSTRSPASRSTNVATLVTTPSSLGMTSTLGTTTSDATSSTVSTCLLAVLGIKLFRFFF